MKRWMYFVLVSLVASSVLVSCGDDDDEAAETADGDVAAFCDGYFELNAGEPTAEKIREVMADAPEAAKAPMEAIAKGFEEKGGEYTDSEEFAPKYEAVTKVVADECADETITVAASEYKFDGIPGELGAGIVAASFENKGAEMHEIIVLRKKDGVTESFDDILAKGEDEADKLVDVSFGAFGPPGAKSTAVFDMTKPGQYAAVCFIAVGTTPDKEEGDGPPHFTQGMKSEFTVG
jgi:hypothetical protein